MNGQFPAGSLMSGVASLAVMLLTVILLLIFAISTAIVAGKKGRNAFGWFFIGLFTGIVGLAIALAILPKKYYVDSDIEDF